MMDKNKPLVSVIVPCYNYAHFLGEALDSVMAQTYPYWECIIINDGSPDNTEEVALKYCKKDSRFKYIHKENGGHSSARNLGIKNSIGKYILPLDADDLIGNNYIEKAVEILDSDENVKLVTGEVQLFGNSNEKIAFQTFDLRSFLIVNFITISSLFRRTDFDKTDGFDETMLYFEDWDFFIKLLKDGGNVIEVPFISCYYRIKKNAIFAGGINQPERAQQDLLKLYYNNIDIYVKFFYTPIDLIQENEKMKRTLRNFQNRKINKLKVSLKKAINIFSFSN